MHHSQGRNVKVGVPTDFWRVRIGVTSFVFVFTRTITFRKLSFVRYVEASEGAGDERMG